MRRTPARRRSVQHLGTGRRGGSRGTRDYFRGDRAAAAGAAVDAFVLGFLAVLAVAAGLIASIGPPPASPPSEILLQPSRSHNGHREVIELSVTLDEVAPGAEAGTRVTVRRD